MHDYTMILVHPLIHSILVQTTGIWQNILEEDSAFYFFKVFSNNLNILLYSSVQLLGCTNPWSSTG